MNTINLFFLLGVTAVATAAELPTLSIDLGPVNRGQGLTVPSGGDGKNVPGRTAAGISFRRMAPDSSYLYVKIDDPAYAASAPVDLYVTAELLDDEFHRVSLQYDKTASMPSIATKYTGADGTVLLTGKGGLRKVHYFLPQARLGHGENSGTDFRFSSGGLAVHRIVVSPRRPVDFSAGGGLDPASIAALRVERPPEMELTIGNDAGEADAAILQALTVTSVESYVDWAGVEPREQGTWDWSKWDRQVDVLRRHELKWVPFLIAGPAYATPLWFQESKHSHCFVCLEHDKPSKVQSIFNPDWPPYVERFLRAFAARYGKTGVIESVLLGVTGIYGESIYPAGPEGGWTARFTGPYHNHAGWWAGDAYAVAAFRKAMRRKYWFLHRLNTAWNSEYRKWDQVKTFLPADAPNDRARADMAQWYQQAMTDWAAFWVKTARHCFPGTEIYLCTGGNGAPVLGADFTAQAKAIAPWRTGIRITNEGSDIAANFTVTREVATATHLYGTFAGFEPAGRVDARGVVARIFNATTSGARQLHYYQPNLLQSGTALSNFRKNARFLVPRRPIVNTAFYVSRETWEVDTGVIGSMYAHARRLRDAVDYDMVTRCSVRDGALRGRRALVLVESDVLEPGAARTIRRWVESGGLLIAAGRSGHPPASRLYDLSKWRDRLFAVARTKSADGLLRRELAGPAPDTWRLELGSAGDSGWIFGDWWNPERALEWPDLPEARKRWSGTKPGVLLPTRPGAAYRLRLDAYLAGHSVRPTGNTVLINGVKVGRLDKAGHAVYEFTVPGAVLGKSTLVRLELHLNTWVPKEHSDSTDARQLGVALHTVEWIRSGVEAPKPAPASLRWTVDRNELGKLVKRVKKGWTVFLPSAGDSPEKLARLAGELLRHTDAYLPGVPPVVPEDGRLDGIYTTRTEKGIVRYDATRAVITTE